MSICLHIGDDATTVTALPGVAPLSLLLGTQRTAAAFFRNAPPTAAELENAIMAVEDEVTRARTLVAGQTDLWTTDDAIRQIALLYGAPDESEMELPIAAVERMFDLLAAMVQGRPASSAGIPTDTGFAATLLILREFMHHLQFAAIRVLASPAAH